MIRYRFSTPSRDARSQTDDLGAEPETVTAVVDIEINRRSSHSTSTGHDLVLCCRRFVNLPWTTGSIGFEPKYSRLGKGFLNALFRIGRVGVLQAQGWVTVME